MTKPALLLALVFLLMPFSARAEAVYLYTASSMADAWHAIAQAFSEQNEAEVLIIPAASGTLARQIERGAPPGIFVAAHADWIDYLTRAGFLAEKHQFAGNYLVLAARCDAESDAKTLREVLAAGKIALADPALAPLGQYAREGLARLGVWEEAQQKAVFADSARSLLTWLLRGEVQAGIIYASDYIAHETRLCVLAGFSSRIRAPVTYWMALTRGAPEPAQRLYQFATTSPKVRAILREHGFTLDEPSRRVLKYAPAR